mgnify:CR=1 FL=1|jgi:hypothetical protein
MPKYFLPKKTKLSDANLSELEKKFELNNSNLEYIKNCSTSHGIVIDTDAVEVRCCPYDRGEFKFFQEFPEGKILEIKN